MSTEFKGLLNDTETEQQIVRREDGNEWRRGIRIWKEAVTKGDRRKQEKNLRQNSRPLGRESKRVPLEEPLNKCS